jgi:hypothetical protein
VNQWLACCVQSKIRLVICLFFVSLEYWTTPHLAFHLWVVVASYCMRCNAIVCYICNSRVIHAIFWLIWCTFIGLQYILHYISKKYNWDQKFHLDVQYYIWSGLQSFQPFSVRFEGVWSAEGSWQKQHIPGHTAKEFTKSMMFRDVTLKDVIMPRTKYPLWTCDVEALFFFKVTTITTKHSLKSETDINWKRIYMISTTFMEHFNSSMHSGCKLLSPK